MQRIGGRSILTRLGVSVANMVCSTRPMRQIRGSYPRTARSARAPHAKRLILLVLLVSFSVGARQAHAQIAVGSFVSAPIFNSSGLASVVFVGGTVGQLEAAALQVGASGVWAQAPDGSFSLLVAGGPSFLADGFRAVFPRGFAGYAAVTLSRAAGPSVAVVPTSGTTPAPSGVVGACASGSRPNAASRSVAQVITNAGTGTAFYIGNGEWLTAGHVVTGASAVLLKSDALSVSAQVLGIDAGRDVAILRSTTVSLDALPIIEASQSDAGIGLWVIGFPLGLSGTPTLTRGTLSRVVTVDGIEQVQTDAPVNSGNSGGPVTDDCGQVVGLVVSKIVGSNAIGLGFALSAQTIKAGMVIARSNPPAAVLPAPTPAPALPNSSLSVGAVCFQALGEEQVLTFEQCRDRGATLTIGRPWTFFSNLKSYAGAVVVLTPAGGGQSRTLTLQDIYQGGSASGLAGLDPGPYQLVLHSGDGRASNVVPIRLTP